MADVFFEAVISGNMASKSNSRRLVRDFEGNPRSIKSQKALDWTESAIWQLKMAWKGRPAYNGPVSLLGLVFYSSRRPDLDVALLMDALQKAGILQNDRQVFRVDFQKCLDAENPRVEMVMHKFKA